MYALSSCKQQLIYSTELLKIFEFIHETSLTLQDTLNPSCSSSDSILILVDPLICLSVIGIPKKNIGYCSITMYTHADVIYFKLGMR